MIQHIANPIYDTVFKYLLEDEYFSAIEHRDTEILMRDKKLAEQNAQIGGARSTVGGAKCEAEE